MNKLKMQFKIQLYKNQIRQVNTVFLLQVNCDGPGYHTCHHAQADIYPTLKLYRNGVEERRYYGERTPSQSIIKLFYKLITGGHLKLRNLWKCDEAILTI